MGPANAPAAAGFGLCSAVSWGGSVFLGGLGARRASALLVTISGHLVSFLALLAVCLGFRMVIPGGHALVYAALGGFEGALALAAFYRALAMGAMGLTAALTGLLTALVPIVFSAIHYGLPAPFTAVGLGVGCVAIFLITHQPAAKTGSNSAVTPPAALLLGALAGTGFGLQLILFRLASSEMTGGDGLLWIMTAARGAGVTAILLVLLAKPPKGLGRGFWLAGISAGALDTVGNLLYLRATEFGRLDVAAVICSLYPAVTILLAALVLRERPTRRQIAGMALALGAVLLLST